MNIHKVHFTILLSIFFGSSLCLEKPNLPPSTASLDVKKFIADKHKIGIGFENALVHYGATEFDISTEQKRNAFLLLIIHGTWRRESFGYQLHYEFNSYLLRAGITYDWLATAHSQILKKDSITAKEFIPLLQEKISKITIK
jgi:hypothetical protein